MLQEGFQSLQNSQDLYWTADTGMRFKVIGGLVSGFQWTVRYNKNPPPAVLRYGQPLSDHPRLQLRHEPSAMSIRSHSHLVIHPAT